jgi:acetyl esterase/lipase
MKLGRFLGHCVALGCMAAAAPLAAQIGPPPLEAYGELPALEHIALSRSGKMAMLASSEGKRRLVVFDQSMQALSAVEVGDIKVRGIRWIGDDEIMIQRSDTQDLGERFIARNAEFYNAMIVPADGQGDVRTIFANDRSVLNAVFGLQGFREIDGKWVGYFGGIPMKMGQAGQYYYDGGRAALYAVDIATNKARRVTSAPLQDEDADWLIDPRGEIAATLTFHEKTGAWRIKNGRGREIASGSKLKGGAAIISFGIDGEKVVYRVSDEHGESEFFQVPLAGGGQPEQLFEGIDIEEVYLDANSGGMIGYLPKDSEENDDPVFFDKPAQDTVGKIISAFRPVGGDVRNWTPDFSRILLTTAGNNDSGTWYLIDTVAGQSHVIGRSRPDIKANQVGPISTVTYKAQDGLEIEGILTLPPGRAAKNLPIVVFPHGGPRSHDEATFDWWAQAFASRGYAVLQPNFRGSTGYGDDFLKAGNGQWGRKMQTDLSDGLAYLAEQGTVDPKRACIMGASYGGYAALAGVTLQTGVYRCSVAVAPVTDLKMSVDQDYRETGSKDLRDYWLELMGDRKDLDTYSPRQNATRADAPILLIHGRDDTVVPYRHSQVMADALKDAGKPYEFVQLREEDHNLSRSETRKLMLQSALTFVQKHNPPD